jgi:hypothetical protein
VNGVETRLLRSDEVLGVLERQSLGSAVGHLHVVEVRRRDRLGAVLRRPDFVGSCES